MKPFAFLVSTPDWAKQNNCGKYNGYIAIDIKYQHKIMQTVFDEETMEPICLNINIPQPHEITYTRITSIDKLRDICPLTSIEQDVFNQEFMVFGFDTCHASNSWEKDDYESVKKDTLEWFDEVIKYLETVE